MRHLVVQALHTKTRLCASTSTTIWYLHSAFWFAFWFAFWCGVCNLSKFVTQLILCKSIKKIPLLRA
jgi:hypothetical protein